MVTRQEALDIYDQVQTIPPAVGVAGESDISASKDTFDQFRKSTQFILRNAGPSSEAIGSIIGMRLGGAAGARAGARLGGPVGAVIGGGLGAAAGAIFPDTLANILGVSEESTAKTLDELVTKAGNAALQDLAFSGGAAAIPEILRGGKLLVAKMLLDEKGVQAVKTAREFGIRLGLQEVGGALAKAPSRVLAQFPLFGSRGRAIQGIKGAEVEAAPERLFLRMGPSVGMVQMGFDLTKMIDESFTFFRQAINKPYKEVRALAKKLGATAKILPQQRKVNRWKGEFLEKNFILIKGERQFTKGAADSKTLELIEEIKNLPPDISFARYEQLLANWDEAVDVARKSPSRKNDLPLLEDIGASLQRAKMSHPEVRAARSAADQNFFRLQTEIFETPLARKANQLLPRGLGQQGFKIPTRNPDVAVKTIMDLNAGPSGMKNLKKLLLQGRPATKRNLRGVHGATAEFIRVEFDGALSRSIKAFNEGKQTAAMDFVGLRKKLGMERVNGRLVDEVRFKTLEEGLKGSGVSIKRVEKLIDSMETAVSVAPVDFNAFIARNAKFSGFGFVKSTLAPGMAGLFAVGGGGVAAGSTGVVGGLITAATLTLLGRGLVNIMADPRMLEAAEIALDVSIGFAKRKSNLVKLNAILETATGGFLKLAPDIISDPSQAP